SCERPHSRAECEHVISSVAQCWSLALRRAAATSMLATSREPLGVDGERTWRVPSLMVPPEHAAADAAEIETDAVRLFIDRARMREPGFRPIDDDRGAIAEICRRLDGIPLAIELAAAGVNVLSCAQIARRLDDRFRFLTGGTRTALERHQTLRAAVDWSYNTLTEAERTLLARLSVFVGGFTLEAVEEVCTDGMEALEALDLVASLVDKSLVVADR